VERDLAKRAWRASRQVLGAARAASKASPRAPSRLETARVDRVRPVASPPGGVVTQEGRESDRAR